MKTLWFAIAFFLIASTATAQEQTCATQIQTANAMIEELQGKILVLSARAAQQAGRAKAFAVELDVVRAELIGSKESIEAEIENQDEIKED